jgi:hypothetical protein
LNAPILVALAQSPSFSANPIILRKAGVSVAGTTKFLNFSESAAAPPNSSGYVVFTPDKPLDANTFYTVEVALNDRPNSTGRFTTGSAIDTSPLQLVSSDPAPGQDGVEPGSRITLRFNKPVHPGSFKPGQFRFRNLTSDYDFMNSPAPEIQADGSTVVFQAIGGTGLLLGTGYQIEFPPSGITDWLGNALSPVPKPIPFTTFRTSPKDGPKLIGTVPAEGEANVPLNSRLLLIFDRPLAKLPFEGGITFNSGGGAIKFTVDNTLPGGRALIIQPSLLLAPNTSALLSVRGVVDSYGAPLSTPFTLGFRTGASVETSALSLTTSPGLSFPRNAPISVTFSRPIHPNLMALGKITLTPDSNGISNPVSYLLSGDHQTLTIAPGTQLPAGSYTAQITIPFDRTQGGLQPFGFGFTFTVTGEDDTTPPVVAAVNPPDGTSGAPLSSLIQIQFSEPMLAPDASANAIRLISGGESIPGSVTLNASQGSFVPASPLSPGKNYQIEIAGLTDLAGNLLETFSSSFTTDSSTSPTDPFRLISVSPASGTANVDPNAQIVLTFNRDANPVSLTKQSARFLYPSKSPQFPILGSFQVTGSTATFTPAAPLPAERYYFSPFDVRDLAGALITPQGGGPQPLWNFLVTDSGPVDDVSPTVISVSPGDGQPVFYRDPYVVLTFSEPLDPATIRNNFQAYTDRGLLAVTATLDSQRTQVSLKFNADPGTLVTLYVNPAVTDLAGNPAVPFRSTVRLVDLATPSSTRLLLQRPSRTSNQPANTPIVLVFSAPLDRASVEQGLFVTSSSVFSNETLVSGKVVWTQDSTGLTFVPATPFSVGATVRVVILNPARDASGNTFAYDSYSSGNNFQIVYEIVASNPALTVVGSSLSPPFAIPNNGVLRDVVIDVKFDRDVPSALVRADIATLVENGRFPMSATACTVTLVSPRILRFKPVSLLRPNSSYAFVIKPGNQILWQVYFSTGPSVSQPDPRMVGFGPRGQFVPLNSQISVAFSNSVNIFNMPGGLSLQANGETIPFSYVWNESGTALTLLPSGLLSPNTDYKVVAANFEDQAAHPIPAQSWTFHTSANIDLQRPSILTTDPSGDSVSPAATIAVTFSEQVSPAWSDRFVVTDQGGPDGSYSQPSRISGRLGFSEDQRTIFFVPDQPLPSGHTITVAMSSVTDFAGNTPSPTGYEFRTLTFKVGFRKTSAPLVSAVSPDDGATDLPLNVQIQARFDQPVLASSLDGISLVENGVAIPAKFQLDADGRTVSAIPVRLPAAGSTYSLLVAGVKNTDGVMMPAQYQSSFTMGSTVDITGPILFSSPGPSQQEVPLSVKVRLRSNESLNKLSVDRQKVYLTRTPFNTFIDLTITLEDQGRTVVVSPTYPLTPNASYSVGYSEIKDLAGNPVSFGANGSFSTSTGAAASPVRLVAIDPPDASKAIPSTTSIQALYSDFVDLTHVDTPVVVSNGVTDVRGTVDGFGGRIVTFKPAHPLPDGTYTAQISGLTDVSGNPIASATSTFTVLSAPPDSTTLRMISSVPASQAVGVPVSSSITMNFSKPVSAVSAAQLRVSSQNVRIPGSFATNGFTVVFTPDRPLPGASPIIVSGRYSDLTGNSADLFFQFTTGADPDTTPPSLSFVYPGEGDRVPSGATQFVLRFSEPMLSKPEKRPIQVYSGATQIGDFYSFSLGEDGQTFRLSLALPPEADITIVITSDLTDFAGNPIQPALIHFRTTSEAELRGPTITSISPTNGAINIGLDSPIEIRFSKAMDAVSVQSNLAVTNGGSQVSGSLSHDDTAQTFVFRPDVAWRAGSATDVFLDAFAYDLTGARNLPFYSRFSTAAPQSDNPIAVSFSASTSAIDVRFSGHAPAEGHSYLRLGHELVPSQLEQTTPDQIRIVPSTPLKTGATYHLVIDAAQEIAIQIEKDEAGIAAVTEVSSDSGIFRVHFSHPVNPLTLRRKGTRLLKPDGTSVGFTTLTSSDQKEVTLVPDHTDAPLTLILEGIESRSGRPVPRHVRRP